MNSILFTRTPLFVALALASAAVQADDNAQQLEEVVVTGEEQSGYLVHGNTSATGLDLDIQKTPQSISIMTQQQLQDFALTSVNSALVSAPGLTVEKPETDRVYYTARGFKVSNFQFDGVGMPLTHDNIYSDLDSAIFERIEILRGANALRSGLGDPSATVNMIRKRPLAEAQAEVTLSAGSWSTYRLQADASARFNGDTAGGRLVVAEQDGDSYLDRYGLKRRVAYAVLEQELSPLTLLTMGMSQQWSWADSPLWGALPNYDSNGHQLDYDVSTSSAADWSYFSTRNRNAFVELQHGFSSGWQLKGTFNYLHNDTDSELFYVSGTPDADTGAGVTGAYASEYDLTEGQRMLDVMASGPFQLAGRTHELMLGVNWSKSRIADESYYDLATVTGTGPAVDLRSWDGNYPRPTFDQFGGAGNWDDKQRAFYSAARFNLTERWQVLAGGRLSNWQRNGVSYGRDRSTSHNNELTPYLGTTYEVLPGVALYASWTETFGPQHELDSRGDNLDPKQSVNYEIGAKVENQEKTLRSSVALFQSLQDNVAVATGDKVPGTTKDAYRADDGIETQGYELEVAGAPMTGLQLSAAYTHLDIKDADDQDTMTYLPGQQFKGALSWQVSGLEALKLGASVTWQDEIYRNQGVVADGINAGQDIIVKQQAYALVNLMASYDINSQLSTAININNVTDEKYLNSLYFAQSYYGAPRNLMASVNWRIKAILKAFAQLYA